jgi:hypothetical protein
MHLPSVLLCDAVEGVEQIVVMSGEHRSKKGSLTSPSPVSGLELDAAYEIELAETHEHIQVQGRDLSPGKRFICRTTKHV